MQRYFNFCWTQAIGNGDFKLDLIHDMVIEIFPINILDGNSILPKEKMT